ncbi:unnamed protein product, partial [Rotaria sp. Silwood2]
NNQGSDSDSEYDFVATESDDISDSEHMSEESDSSNSDFEQGDVVTTSQRETLQKAGTTWSIHPNLVHSCIVAANIMKKKKPGPTTKVQTILDAFKLFFTNEIIFSAIFQCCNEINVRQLFSILYFSILSL